MILGSTVINSNKKFQAFKFGEHPVGTSLCFYFSGIGRRPGKGQDFDVVEAMAFDMDAAVAKGVEGALGTVKYLSFSMQAQIDSYVNGREDKKTGKRGTPCMFVGKFYKLTYKTPAGTEYTDSTGALKQTQSIGYELEQILVDEGTAAAFQVFLVSENIPAAMEAYRKATAGMVQGVEQVSQEPAAPSNLPKL